MRPCSPSFAFQMSTFGLGFIKSDFEAQRGTYGMLRTCMRAGDAAEARRWLHACCAAADGGG